MPRRPADRPPPATPPLLRALAHVGETDLLEGLGPERFAALARLTGEAGPRRRSRWPVALGVGVLAAAALAVLLAR